MRAHIVIDGVIVNTVVVEVLADIPGAIDADLLGGSIGDLYSGGVVTKAPIPPAPVPEVVSKFQAKASLLNAGYLETVEGIMADAGTPMIARLAWTEAQEFRRDSPTVAMMAAALSLTSEQVDDMFRYAEKVVA